MANNNLKYNIIKWYPFTKDSEILEIKDNIEEIEEKQYDYVVMLGTLEYANKLFQDKNPENQLIEFAKKHLKEEGKLLIAVNNKLGIINYCQSKHDMQERKKFNRKQLEELLQKNGLNHYKFYYPLPSYENTNVIFTDEFLPNQETITRNVHLHEKEDILLKSENDMFLEIIEQDKNLFKIFTNSYLVECSRMELTDNKIQLVSFSNMRKQEYCIQTIIRGDTVYKTAGNEQAKTHIQSIKNNIDILNKLGFKTLDSYQEDTVTSKYQKEKQSLDNIIVNKIKNGQKEEATQLIIQFFNEIKEKLSNYKTEKNIFDFYQIPYEKSQIEGLNFTKYGLWDLILQNVFYIDNQFYFYDQEWMEDGIPIEYIFYRSIRYTRELKDILDVETIWQKFGINKEHIELFLLLDEKIQESIRDEEIWELSKNGKYVEDIRIDFLTANHKVNLLNIENVQKDEKIAQDEQQIKELTKKLEGIYDSKSWKLAQKISKFKNKF